MGKASGWISRATKIEENETYKKSRVYGLNSSKLEMQGQVLAWLRSVEVFFYVYKWTIFFLCLIWQRRGKKKGKGKREKRRREGERSIDRWVDR